VKTLKHFHELLLVSRLRPTKDNIVALQDLQLLGPRLFKELATFECFDCLAFFLRRQDVDIASNGHRGILGVSSDHHYSDTGSSTFIDTIGNFWSGWILDTDNAD